ncbi:neck protein [Ochrobactrum phage vB_OspM_OC]|nr:neck protein [Ochrobactrum phage vB_OspM_OC]
MSTSPYFRHFDYTGTQKLVTDLIIEAIKIYGYDIKYVPRTIIQEDKIFGEDRLSRFEASSTIEMYIKNVDGFAGQGKFLSKWGIEVRDQITFTVSKLRYEQAMTESLLTEDGAILHMEESAMRSGYSNHYDLEEGSADGYTLPAPRPRAGDLVYFGQVDKLFEIKNVNYETIFYQLGELQVYDLECEVFDYSHEEMETGDDTIDSIMREYSSDTKFDRLITELGAAIENEGLGEEEFGELTNEEYQLEDSNNAAQNRIFDDESETLIDWSEKSPFSGRKKK